MLGLSEALYSLIFPVCSMESETLFPTPALVSLTDYSQPDKKKTLSPSDTATSV